MQSRSLCGGAVRLGRRIDQEAAITPFALRLPPAVVGPDGPVAQPTALRSAPVEYLPVAQVPGPVDLVGSFIGEQLAQAVTGLMKALSQDFLAELGSPVARYVLSTPDVLAEPTLRSFWLVALTALTVCAGLLVALAGLTMTAGTSSQLGRAAQEVVGVRLVGCLLTAAMSLPVVALEIGLANRLVDAFVAEGFAAGENPLWTALSRAFTGDVGAGLALVVTAVVGVLLLVCLVVIGLARWATLWLLIILSPVVMGFALLPSGQSVARLWWRLQLVTVFLPVANAVLLGTYVAMFTSEQSGLVGALAGVAVLALMTKLPSWAAGAAVGVDAGELTGRLRRGSAMTRRALAPGIGSAATAAPTAAVVGAAGRQSAGRATRYRGRGGADEAPAWGPQGSWDPTRGPHES